MNGTKPIAILAGIGMITALVGTSSAQFLSLDGFTEPIIAHAKTNDKLVSVSFDNATTRDVIQWMTKSNLNFIFKKTEKSSNQRISMKLTDVPATEAIEAICDALGMSYSKKGSTYVITESPARSTFGAFATTPTMKAHPAPSVRSTASPRAMRVDEIPAIPAIPGIEAMPAMPAMPAIEIDLAPLEAMKGFAFADGEHAKANKAAQKAADEAMKAALEAEKAAANNDTKRAVEMAKEAAAAAKRAAELSKAHSFDFKMDEKALRKIRDEVARMPNTKEWKQFAHEMKALGQTHGAWAHVLDSKELIKSITPAQWELHKKQGFLKLSDLTDAQRKMLGNPVGSIHIQINKDGVKLSIRSEDSKPARSTSISTSSPAI